MFKLIPKLVQLTFVTPWYIKPEPIADRAVLASPYVIHLYLESVGNKSK